MEDLHITGQLTGGQRIMAQALPLAMSVGFIGGLFMSRAIEKRMKNKKNEPVADLVDIWNQHFFHARRLHVILAHGSENISGDVDGPAPDWGHRSQSNASSSSDSSSSDDDRHGRHDKFGRHAERRQFRAERKAERRARRREDRGDRRARKADKRSMKYEKYRLVILSI